MNLKNFWEGTKNYLYKNYGQNSGTMILHVGALGWLFSSVAQIFGVISNDKYTPQEKKFLIPQEVADGFVNVLSFYFVTKCFKDVGQKLVKTGKWSNQAITKFVREHGEADKLNKISTNLEEIFEKKKDSKLVEAFHKEYGPFKNGVDMITTTIGSILSCNFITPVLRNTYGANRQKKAIAEENMKNAIDLPLTPILPAQNRFSLDDYKNHTTGVARITQNSNSMRI